MGGDVSEIDKAIAELKAQLDTLETQAECIARKVVAIEGEIRGLERARDLFAPPEAGAGRRDVQGPVMEFLGDGGVWKEKDIAKETELPDEAVHKFLVRAVRAGKVVIDNGGYAIRREAVRSAAE